MRVWINALSTTNASGQHVLRGLLRGLTELGTTWSFVVGYPAGCAGFPMDAGPAVKWCACPPITRHWWWRHIWERMALASRIKADRGDVLLNMSGTTLHARGIREVSLAMNPWALVPDVLQSPIQSMKGALQRGAYRRAVRTADGMAYLSGYLQAAYHGLAGSGARRETVVYTGVDEDVWAYGGRCAGVMREPGRIVCVSAMAAHKGVETLLSALHRLRTRCGREARLTLMGGWPDDAYARRIRAQVETLALTPYVTIAGHVPRAELLEGCARAEVFALLSRCESFGIPGVEAQALGTPVVCSRVGALPEIYGAGALAVSVDDPVATADALDQILGDAAFRQGLSVAAQANAQRFRQPDVSRGLYALLRDVTGEVQT